jgi:DNA-directed RNA polymerase specialized sigma24 family protein
VWALDDEKIKQLILCRFPEARTDPEQRRLASRMVRLIHLYYRVGSTAGVVAEEFNMTVNAVRQLIHRIETAMKRPLKPSHREKK